jgi:hypothetical protein
MFLTLKGSSSGAKSNKLTTHIQISIYSQTSDNNNTIIEMETVLKNKIIIIKWNAQSKIKKHK